MKCLLTALLLMLPLDAKDQPSPERPPRRLEIVAEADPSLNRDPVGNPLSVVVRVYQLKDKGEFTRLTHDLAASGRPEPELLGPDCLGKCEFTLIPGSVHQGSAELLPDTRYLGVVALFRQPDPEHWRCLAKVDPPSAVPAAKSGKKSWFKRVLSKNPTPEPPPRNPALCFKVQDCYLRLLSPQAEPIPGQTDPFRPDCQGAGVLAPAPLEPGTETPGLRAAR